MSNKSKKLQLKRKLTRVKKPKRKNDNRLGKKGSQIFPEKKRKKTIQYIRDLEFSNFWNDFIMEIVNLRTDLCFLKNKQLLEFITGEKDFIDNLKIKDQKKFTLIKNPYPFNTTVGISKYILIYKDGILTDEKILNHFSKEIDHSKIDFVYLLVPNSKHAHFFVRRKIPTRHWVPNEQKWAFINNTQYLDESNKSLQITRSGGSEQREVNFSDQRPRSFSSKTIS